MCTLIYLNRSLGKTHYEELRDLYLSPDIVTVISSRNVRWMETRNASRVLVRKPEGKRQLVDVDKDGRIILHVFWNKMGIQWFIFGQTGNKPRISVYKILRHWSMWRVRQRHVDKIPIHRKTSDLWFGNVSWNCSSFCISGLCIISYNTTSIICTCHVYSHVLFLCRFTWSSVRWDDSRSSHAPFCEVSDWLGTGECWQTIDNQHKHLQEQQWWKQLHVRMDLLLLQLAVEFDGNMGWIVQFKCLIDRFAKTSSINLPTSRS